MGLYLVIMSMDSIINDIAKTNRKIGFALGFLTAIVLSGVIGIVLLLV
ncbi:MAG: hypothetical protein AAFX55_09330 [Bacteroidota bacterium]